MVDFYFSPLGGFVFLDSGFPQWDDFVGGYFLLVLGCYCFSFFLYSWHYLVVEMDLSYSTFQKNEVIEWERDEQS